MATSLECCWPAQWPGAGGRVQAGLSHCKPRAWQKGQEEGPVQPQHQAGAPSSLPHSSVMKLQGKSKEGMCVCPPRSDIVIWGKGCSFLLTCCQGSTLTRLDGSFRSLDAQIKLSHCCGSGAQASVPGHILLAY